MNSRQRQLDSWVSLAGRIVGLLGLVVFGIIWALEQRIESLLVAASGALYGIGKVGEAWSILRQPPPVSTEPPASPPRDEGMG